jgi:hypothetical protein
MLVVFTAHSSKCKRALRAFDVDDPVTGEVLLGFREDPVGNRLAVIPGPDQFRFGRRREPLGRNAFARRAQLLAERVHERNVPLDILLRHAQEVGIAVARAVHHQHVLHG